MLKGKMWLLPELNSNTTSLTTTCSVLIFIVLELRNVFFIVYLWAVLLSFYFQHIIVLVRNSNVNAFLYLIVAIAQASVIHNYHYSNDMYLGPASESKCHYSLLPQVSACLEQYTVLSNVPKREVARAYLDSYYSTIESVRNLWHRDAKYSLAGVPCQI